jgi:simple sugar transport system permease protein
MLAGAWTAAVVTLHTHNAWIALLPAIAVGASVMALHAGLCLFVRSDHIIGGLVVNLFAAGITPLACKWLYTSPTNTPMLPLEDRFTPMGIWGFHQMPLTYLALLSVFALHWMLSKTRYGLRLKAAGEHPTALLSCGVRPDTIRFPAMLAGGALCALGGAFLSVSHASQFTRDMTAGRGYIALTALIFGGWRPVPAAGACVLFGLADATQIRLQSAENLLVPVQFIQAFPYFITFIVLVGFIGKTRAPAALGRREGIEQ